MAWLGTYSKRRKVTVSNTNIDSDVTHFPLLLTLGTSVGTGNTDVSSIFDELTSDANRFKIAFTKTDGTTQLYAEIEKWDDANETAVIWVSKSDLVLASGATTDIYMYYDSTQADNTTYIGDTNSTPAESVWDSNFKMVQHMADGASTSATYDSTSNNNDGTKKGAGEPAVTTSGEIGNAQDFDGTDDYISKTDNDSLDVGASVDYTIEAWFNSSYTAAGQAVYYKYDDTTGYLLLVRSPDGYIQTTIRTDASTAKSAIASANGVTDGAFHKIVGVADRDSATGLKLYVDGLEVSSYSTQDDPSTATGDLSNVDNAIIGADSRDVTALLVDGIIDELRISIGIARSAAYIKASYYSETDALVSWGAEKQDTGNSNFLIFF